MPWVTVYWQDTGDIYSIAWPNAPTPYPGDAMFGSVETMNRPDTRCWDHEARSYGDIQLRGEAMQVGLGNHEKPPMDPAVLEAAKAADARQLQIDIAVASALALEAAKEAAVG